MECLSVDGGAPRLWADKHFTTESGTVSFGAVVPTGLPPKSTVCGQSFLKTQGSFGPVTRWSEKTCFPVGKVGSFSALSRSPSPPSASPTPAPDSRSTPTTRGPISVSPPTSPPSSGDYQPPWPPWEKMPKISEAPPVSSTPTTTVPLKAPAPRKSQGNQAAAPAPATPKSTTAPSQTLPRTGAGVIVLSGVAAVALFSGRTLRKASDHIADNLPVPAIPLDDDDEPTLILGRRW
jgi:hypothetical protein